MKSLSDIQKEYEKIMQLNEPKKSRLLADLMTDMEREYKIPMQRLKAWEKANKAVIAMYRKLSMSRDI